MKRSHSNSVVDDINIAALVTAVDDAPQLFAGYG
jgi:hypothetical protein